MNSRLDSGWNNPKVWMILGVMFLCGTVCGCALGLYYMHGKVPRVPRYSITRLESELNMTPAQRQTIQRELDDYAKYYQNIEEERQSVAEQGKRNIKKVLNPEQQKRFEEMFHFPASVPCQTAATVESTQ